MYVPIKLSVYESIPKRNVLGIGYGTLSLIIFIFACFFSFNIGSEKAIGDIFLESIGVYPWTGYETGFHYTIIFSLSMTYFSWLLGDRYKEDLGAVIGKNLSKYFSIIVSIMAILYSLL